MIKIWQDLRLTIVVFVPFAKGKLTPNDNDHDNRKTAEHKV